MQSKAVRREDGKGLQKKRQNVGKEGGGKKISLIGLS